MKHTSGPWYIVRTTAEYLRINQDEDGRNADIAHVQVWQADGYEQTEVNARLIVAAPELLEVCKMTLQDILQGTLAGPPETVEAARNNLRNVISKAEEGEPL